MKLLLTSTGFTNPKLGEIFISLLEKPIDKVKVIFIPTASRTEHELNYVKESKEELIQLGIKLENLLVYNLDKKLSYENVKDNDVVYICGGNTFYLTAKMREDSFDRVIKRLVKEGRLYLGVSAGSVLAGPNIDIASPFDPNDIGLKDLNGLKLTNIIVCPHYDQKEKQIIEEYKKKEKYQIIPITNTEALLVLDKETKIVE